MLTQSLLTYISIFFKFQQCKSTENLPYLAFPTLTYNQTGFLGRSSFSFTVENFQFMATLSLFCNISTITLLCLFDFDSRRDSLNKTVFMYRLLAHPQPSTYQTIYYDWRRACFWQILMQARSFTVYIFRSGWQVLKLKIFHFIFTRHNAY